MMGLLQSGDVCGRVLRGMLICCLGVVVLAVPGMVQAQETGGGEPCLLDLKGPRLTGDWMGARTKLEESGVKISLCFNDQFMTVVDGGLDTNGWGKNSASFDAVFAFDLEKLGLIPDAEFLLHAHGDYGSSVNRLTGALNQVNDDADGYNGIYIGQCWYRQHFWDRKIALRIGFLDFQTVIERNKYANSEDKQFMHFALDNNPLVPLNVGLGVALTVTPCDFYSFKIGASDGQAVFFKPGFSTAFHDDAIYWGYMEHGFHFKFDSPRGALPGSYRIGSVYDPRPRPLFPKRNRATKTDTGDYGVYFGFDQMLYRESDQDEQGLGLFGRFAYRHSDRNRIYRFWSGGLSYTGLIPNRDKDVMGLAFITQESSKTFRDRLLPDANTESVYEFYYKIQATGWLTIAPTFQYIDNPGATDSVGHATIAGIRFRVTL